MIRYHGEQYSGSPSHERPGPVSIGSCIIKDHLTCIIRTKCWLRI